ncbi:MAG TPA: aspartate/glutamate racemase family protein [Candidatus Paceibacterota bacterium]|nr:aspartate/glutamate racemase family protein [Candidatus Paceibacterota bacterium]
MIGVFDSGSGGLTVLTEIRTRLPKADLIYFGDIRNAPYGPRSKEELLSLTGNALAFLQRHGATRYVSACNSVSTSLALSLLDTLSIGQGQIIEMVGPSVRSFKGSTERIGLVATSATIDSGIYQNAFHMIGKEVEAIAIPELAGAIEAGARTEEVDRIVNSALGEKTGVFDVLVLACTHYPLALESFKRELGSSTRLYNPAVAVGEKVEEAWGASEEGTGTLRFFISQDSETFRGLVAQFFAEGTYTIEVIE